MKAATRGKKKIAKHTANAAQGMHRISTGTKSRHARKNFIACFVFCAAESFGAMNGAGGWGEFVNSKRVVT